MSCGRPLSRVGRSCFKLHNLISPSRLTSTTIVNAPSVDLLDEFTSRLVQEKSQKWRTHSHREHEHEQASTHQAPHYSFVHKLKKENTSAKVNPHCTPLSIDDDTDRSVLTALSSNKHDIVKLLLDCEKKNGTISPTVLLKLFKTWSLNGQVDKMLFLQTYTQRLHPKLFLAFGEFSHLLAKAHCFKGNSEKGLTLLSEAYGKNSFLRSVYRGIFRELVQDTVRNRSEASLVVFRRHVEDWSERWQDHYPLVCFWHSCWASSWYSDQKLADELMEAHEPLRKIIKERASSMSVTALHSLRDDDAVVRLLQCLLKHDLMLPYATVLQILFNFRLNNRDLRGCAEILQNCKTLGITMNSSLHGKYILMIIAGEDTVRPSYPTPKAPFVSEFKLKF